MAYYTVSQKQDRYDDSRLAYRNHTQFSLMKESKMKRHSWLRKNFGLILVTLLALLVTACDDDTTPTLTSPATSVKTSNQSQAANSVVAPAITRPGTPNNVVPPTAIPIAGGDKTGVTDIEIKVGSWGPQSGVAAAYGIEDRVVDAYFKLINQQGGINGRKIKFIYEDDQYQAAKTEPLVKKMVEQDKVFAFVAGLGTANNLAVKDYLASKNIPNVAFLTGAGALTNPPQPNAFAQPPNYTFEATLFARYAAEQLGAKRVAVLYQNDGFGKEGQQAFSKTSKEKNLEVVAEVAYEGGATDLAAQALKLQQAGADTVFVAAVPGPALAALKEMDKLQYKPKILLSYVLFDAGFFQSAGKAAEGAYISSYFPPPDGSDPKAVQFRDFMTKNLPNEPIGVFAEAGYLATQIFVEGLKRAGRDLSRESFVAGLQSIIDWRGSLSPNITYGPNNRAPQNTLLLYQYKDGKFNKLTDLLPAKP